MDVYVVESHEWSDAFTWGVYADLESAKLAGAEAVSSPQRTTPIEWTQYGDDVWQSNWHSHGGEALIRRMTVQALDAVS